ncbi:MAG: diguanylate cyclase, partial [Rivularia sp. (in: cyanobacteria)]
MTDNLIYIDNNVYEAMQAELINLRHCIANLTEANYLTNLRLEQNERLLNGIAKANNCLLTIEDYEQSMNAALAALGNAAIVDRIYIFKIHPHPNTSEMLISQRWEWIAPGIIPEIDNPQLQNISYDTFLPRWHKNFTQGKPISGLVKDFPQAEREALERQNILSILVMP